MAPEAPAAEPAAPESLLDDPNKKPTGDEPKKEPTGEDPNKPTKPEPDAAKPGEDGKPKVEDKPAGAPEQYAAPKLPDGFEINEDVKKSFDETAKKMNLTQDQYQQFADIGAKMSEANRAKAIADFERQKADWATETKKELGADQPKALAAASKAIDRIFTEAEDNKNFRAMMSDTGLGNWKLMHRVFQFIGKAIGEDTFIPGKPGNNGDVPAEDRIFDRSPTTPTKK